MPELLEQLDCGGFEIRFRSAGSGPAMVLLHGLLGYSFSWRRVIPILASNSTVFAVDMPGAGFCECRPDLDGRLASAAGRLIAFLDAAGIECCDLVGSSYGGATVALAAACARERVRSLIMVAPANPWSRIGQKRLALLRNPPIARLFPAVARSLGPLHWYFVRRMWGDGARVTRETLHGYALPLARPGVFEQAVRTVRTWKADMRELAAALPKIAGIPALLVWGDKDRVVDPRSARAIKALLPEAEVQMVAGAGHLPYDECPEEFASIVETFVGRVRSQDAGARRTAVT
ncbi:MAG: alpha/beta fold hydrolase [Acidobacteria bacterium]|nr:alpha/beta fold hydrolase [Acidobacteriota bacterium]